jgi:hypothetical protein
MAQEQLNVGNDNCRPNIKSEVFPRVAEIFLRVNLNEARRLLSSGLYRPDDGGSTDLSNVGKLIPVYTALQPRRQPSS